MNNECFSVRSQSSNMWFIFIFFNWATESELQTAGYKLQLYTFIAGLYVQSFALYTLIQKRSFFNRDAIENSRWHRRVWLLKNDKT